jgi:hypothetical protein
MSIMVSLRREVERTLLQCKLHHPLQSFSCQMKSQKRSQLEIRKKEVTQMTTQSLKAQIRRMEVLMINQCLRSGRWSFFTMMESVHAFRPSRAGFSNVSICM